MIPIVMFFVCMYLVIAPIVEAPQIEYLYASMYIVFGAIIYIPFCVYGFRLKCIGKALQSSFDNHEIAHHPDFLILIFRLLDSLTRWVQMILSAVPCDRRVDEEDLAVPDLHSDLKIEPIFKVKKTTNRISS